MKTKRLRHVALTLAIALVMLVMPAMTCMQGQSEAHNLTGSGEAACGQCCNQDAIQGAGEDAEQAEFDAAQNAGAEAVQAGTGTAQNVGTCEAQHAGMNAGAEAVQLIQADLAQLFAPDVAYAATSSSKAKSIATKDAKSRYRISKTYKVSAKSATYRNNGIWKVTFYGKKSKDKYNYIYYVSKSSGKIMYRKQY